MSRINRMAHRLALLLKEGESPEIKVYPKGDEVIVRAAVGDDVVGTAVFERDGKYLKGKDLWVRRSVRKRGIASLMYKAVEEKGFVLEPSDQLTPAGQGFWQSRGMSESETRRRHIEPGAHPNDILLGD